MAIDISRNKQNNIKDMELFNPEQKEKARYILSSKYSKISTLSSQDKKNLCCAWCYYSGKIEGNTYTFVETAALLQDGITSEKRYDDARMLKNLYNTFVSEMQYIEKQGNQEEISERTLLRIHQMLASGLESSEKCGVYRWDAVRIGGTDYIPPRDRQTIISEINRILYEQEQFADPFEKAVFLHCNIAKTQPFFDANKRTSRMIESLVLMNNDIIPCYSTKDADILHYRKAIVDYYENGDYSSYIDYFLDKQIENILQIHPETKTHLLYKGKGL